jgi:hypothetical protein
MELKIHVKEYILVSLEELRGTFSSMEKNKSKKINLHAFNFYRLDEKQNKLYKKHIFGDFVLQQIPSFLLVSHIVEHRPDVVACLRITYITYLLWNTTKLIHILLILLFPLTAQICCNRTGVIYEASSVVPITGIRPIKMIF